MNREEAEALFGIQQRSNPPYGMAYRCVILDKNKYPLKDKDGKIIEGKEFSLEPINKMIYFYLQSRCCDTDVTWVSQETIAYDLGMTREWACKKMRPLIDIGLVQSKKVKGNHNVYCLIDVKLVYGEVAFKSWKEIDEERRGVQAATKRDVNCSSLSEPVSGDVNASSLSDVNASSLLDVNASSHKVEEGEIEKGKEKNSTPPLEEKRVHSFAVEQENSKEGNNDKATKQHSPFAVEKEGRGNEQNLNTPQRPQDDMMKIRKAAAEKKKQEDQARSENRWMSKKVPKLKPGQTMEDFEEGSCSRVFHQCFMDCMKETGYHAPKWTPEYSNMWKKALPKFGTIANGLKFIEYAIKNWAAIIHKTNLAGAAPTINLLCSIYMDQTIASLLKPQPANQTPNQPSQEGNSMGYRTTNNRIWEKYGSK